MKKIDGAFRMIGMLTALLLTFQWVSAQTGTVRGTVKDASGNPLAGASVTVEDRKSVV